MSSFWLWWQHLPERIDPVLLQLGPLQIRYYGLMYLSSFLVVYAVLVHRIKKEKLPYTAAQCEDLIIWAVCGALAGGRIGYVLFYDFTYFAAHPLEVFWPFRKAEGMAMVGISGLSYHGGLIGVFTATYLFCRRNKLPFWRFVDFFIPAVPLGYTCGRIGNFLNGELWGRVTTVPWGMYFPGAPTGQLRHPSQLYEALGEGVILFLVLWTLRNKAALRGYLFWAYIFGYGLARFSIEFFRQPDEHLGLLWAGLSMGQWLTLAMLVIPVLVFLSKPKQSGESS
ncbi:MAG: prolipoprotein diacylglyceryl transferase [Candidatus Omnitrophica bacterium]|nr:prolipoprotein diacylglyceryl transferase [Candidatus Omnitrophota bacterium]